ncbi:MAG: hypothetical protein V3581_00220 [Candidatus Cardinium sp.]
MKPPNGALSIFPSVRWYFQRLFTEGLIFCPLFYQEKSGIQLIINQYREQIQEKSISIAKAMVVKGYPIEDIMLLTGLSRAHIQSFL